MLHAIRWLSENIPKKRKRSSSKNHRGKNKRTEFSRRYSSSSSASESSESSSLSSVSDSSDGGSSKNTSTQHLVNESAFDESESPFDPNIVKFAAESAFQGLKKFTRKNMLKDSPVSFHADLRPRKVDSFVKKYLKRSRTAFNQDMDRRLMDIAGKM